MAGGEGLLGSRDGRSCTRAGRGFGAFLGGGGRHRRLVDFITTRRLQPAAGVSLGEGLQGGDPSGDLGGVRLGLREGRDFPTGPGVLLLQVRAGGFDFGREGRVVVHALEFGLRRVGVVRVDAPLLQVREEGLQRVEVRHLDRVELVVVALGATERRTQPGRRHRPHPFGAVFSEVFLGLRAALARHHVQPVVAGRHLLFDRGVGEQVARELLAREGVERLVRVERVDDVVAVREDALVLVTMVAHGVGEARDIQPPHGHALAEVRRSQQPVDLLLIGVGRVVRDEGGELRRRRRQAGQVERDAAEEAFLRRLGRRRDLLLGELGADEGVDGVAAAGGQRGDRDRLQRHVGPVRLVGRPLRDPATEEFLLRLGQGLVGLLLRHQVLFVLGVEALDDLGFVGLARDDRERAALAGLEGFVAEVEAEATLARLRVEPVAVEAGVRHDRPDVAVEHDGVGRLVGGREQDGTGQGGGGEEGETQARRLDGHTGMTTSAQRGFNANA